MQPRCSSELAFFRLKLVSKHSFQADRVSVPIVASFQRVLLSFPLSLPLSEQRCDRAVRQATKRADVLSDDILCGDTGPFNTIRMNFSLRQAYLETSKDTCPQNSILGIRCHSFMSQLFESLFLCASEIFQKLCRLSRSFSFCAAELSELGW